MEGLLEIEGERDFVVLLAAAERRRHPETFSSIDDVFHWVAISAVRDASSAGVEVKRAVLIGVVFSASRVGSYSCD